VALSKILDLERTDFWLEEQRQAGRKIGFTCGSFDLLHAGHVQYLEAARALCDVLLVAVNSDASIQRYKSPLRPIQPLAHRQYLLAALECVDAVTTLEQDRPIELIERWKPDFYIKGGDYAPEKLRSASFVSSYGGQTVVIPPSFPTSTSKVIERIRLLDTHSVPAAAAPGPSRIVFLDRDGTLIDNVNFLHEPERLRLRAGVAECLVKLRAAGFRLVMVTNQQGIGLGYFNMDDFIAVNQRLLREVGAAGASIDRIYFCPHSQADQCECRKPLPGMLLRACRDFGVRPADCFLIGDTSVDAGAAAAAGIRSFLVSDPAPDFAAAAAWVIAEAGV
jgi:rfaE bifunctional protein nucleotidyltransferase chain/domain